MERGDSNGKTTRGDKTSDDDDVGCFAEIEEEAGVVYVVASKASIDGVPGARRSSN